MVTDLGQKSVTVSSLSTGRKSETITDLCVVIFELIIPS
jgi:hypothetical protein